MTSTRVHDKLEAMPPSKAKLLHTTMQLMADKGFESMGIQAILDAAGVSKSNFYYHFKSKEALCLDALELMIEEFTAEVLRPTLGNKELSSVERIERFFRCGYEVMTSCCCKRGCPFVNLATETSDFFPGFRARLDVFFGEFRRMLKSCYQDGADAGLFRSELEPEAVAAMILALINGTMVAAKASKNAEIILVNQQMLLQMLKPVSC